MNRTNEVVLKELQSTIEDANVDLDMKPYAVRGGFSMRKNDAVLAVPRLREEYKSRIFGNMVFVFARGDTDKTRAFVDVARQEAGVFTVDADEIYRLLTDKIDRTIGQHREFTVHQFTILNDGIDDYTKGSERDLTVPASAMRALDSTPTKEDLVNYVRALVTSVHGTALVERFASEQVVDQALDDSFSGKIAALVVTNASEAVEQALAGMAKVARTSVVDCNVAESIDRTFAINTIKEAQKAIKKTK